MQIILPDGTVKEHPSGVTPAQIAAGIGPGLAKAAIGAKVNGDLWDLHRPLPAEMAQGKVSIITRPKTDKEGRSVFRDADHQKDALYLLRHSCAHVMAEAICKLWPQTQLAYGPPLDTGFYYDIFLPDPISTEDFARIEAEMKNVVAENRHFIRYELPLGVGFEKLGNEGNKYKKDNAEKAQRGGAKSLSWYVTGPPERVLHVDTQKEYFCLGGGVVIPSTNLHDGYLFTGDQVPRDSLTGSCRLTLGKFEDLCMGPHVPSTGVIGAFKVTSIAASHWHGDVNSDRFQRVYGTAFFTQADLDHYQAQLEEAKQRDHRVLGQKLGLFAIDEQVGSGLILWKPRGAKVRMLLEDFLRAELLKRGYEMVFTPHIGKVDLYKTSGHYPYYADSQFPTIKMREQASGGGGEEEYLLKPMNCPHHIKIYASDPHSYRDLPIRLAEFGTVYRYEQSGELTGMIRVRGFTQDDAHIFCTDDQAPGEFRATIELVQFVLGALGFSDFQVRLGLRDPANDKYTGDPRKWEAAEGQLRKILADMKLDYVEGVGEAAFYGPKVDFLVKDVIGRKWQLGTVQLDYNLPERFKLEYVGADNAVHRPVMIHRAPFGSMERFMGILIEHFAGAFPLWLAPEQIRVLPISDKFTGYGRKVLDALTNPVSTPAGGAASSAATFRATLDDSGDRVQAKIKVAQELKVPYMLVVGGKDEAAGTVSVRCRQRGDLGAMPLARFLEQAVGEVASRGKAVVAV